MAHKLVADFYINSIYDLTPQKAKEIGVKTLLVDLDNTLAPYFISQPEMRTYQFVESFLNEGFEIIIISNNTFKRTSNYASKLHLPFISSCHKPFKRRIGKYISAHSLNKKGILYVGDQIINDMFLAKRLRLRSLLTYPLTKRDHISAKLVRPLDLHLRKVYKKQSRLGINLQPEEER